MKFPTYFFMANEELNTYEKHVPAPYIRKVFDAPMFKSARITVSGLGFYKLYLNGRDITKGLLAPYISNPDDIVYFDCYDVTDKLKDKNVLGIVLGNGMQNAPGGRVWDFDIARFRGAPRFALSLTLEDDNGKETVLEADESFKWAPSPIIFDDLRSGCFYDATKEIAGWLEADFDDSDWKNVKRAEMPRGKFRLCEADPIVITNEIKPVQIKPATLSPRFDNRENMRLNTQFKFEKRGKTGMLFDFGVNTAGIFRLTVDGKKGQQIYIMFCEFVDKKGEVCDLNTGSFYPDGYCQSAYYVCKGEKGEGFTPDFTYMGYRYALVYGLEEEQINENTLIMLVANSDLKTIGGFNCSDETMNALRDMGHVSDLANFYYFPTDCPHREKNGWTGDAAVSAEHMLLTLSCENSYKEWLRNICASQMADGSLYGIVPTAGWGEWVGPAWDSVLSELCWQIYRLRGDLTPARESAASLLRYLAYIYSQRNDRGLVELGLGDWLQPGKDAGDPTAPVYLTSSVMTMYIAKKSSDLFGALGLKLQKEFADKIYEEMRTAIRKNLIDFNTMTAINRSQTAQAICLYYGVFDECEKPEAGKVLVKLVHEKGDKFDCGMIGMRVIFHALSDCGASELAYKMITRDDFPSYGMLIRQGCTALTENFLDYEECDTPNSLNHHFMGDINGWFLQRIVGIRINPRFFGVKDVDITPFFLEKLSFAEGYYGKIKVKWSRKKDGKIELNVSAPKDYTGFIRLPEGYVFENKNREKFALHGSSITKLASGKYTAVRV